MCQMPNIIAFSTFSTLDESALSPFSEYFLYMSCVLQTKKILYTQKDLERYNALVVFWVFTWILIQNNSLVLAPQAKVPSSAPD